MSKIKKIIKFLWNEFIYGGHLHSLGVVGIVFTSALVLEVKISWDFLLIVYLGLHSMYLYNRFKEFKVDLLTNPRRTQYLKKYVQKIPLIIICLLIILIGIMFYFGNRPALIFGIFLLTMGIFYSQFLKKLTKKMICLKNFFIALMFSSLVILLFIYYSYDWTLGLILIFLFIFLRVFNNTIFFDIKDIESDRKKGLLTLPVMLEKRKLFHFLSIINILSGIPIILGFFLKVFPIFSLLFLLTIPYSFYYFKKSKEPKTDLNYLSYVIADGEYLFWVSIILVGKFLL